MTYEEKAKLAMRINKRMRDIINKTGLNSAEFDYFENRIQTGTLKTATAYNRKQVGEDEEGEPIYEDESYYLLSRSKADIESYSEEDLLRLEQSTRTWSQVKKEVTDAMARQQADDGEELKAPTLSEINEFLSMRKLLRDWFEESSDLVYQLLEITNWEDIGSHTDQEIYDQLKKIREAGEKTYNETERDAIRSEYRDRRKKMEDRMALGR